MALMDDNWWEENRWEKNVVNLDGRRRNALARIAAWKSGALSLTDCEFREIPKELAGLTNLTSLDLSDNKLDDITTLTGLTNLTSLKLKNNNLVNVEALAKLTKLTSLDLDNNQLVDVTPLAELNKLTSLNLNGNQLVDVAPLASLNKLTSLSLFKNQLVDVAPLVGLNKLTSLNLNGNQLVDIAPLAGLNKLTSLYLFENQLVDVAPLAGLNKLTSLDLGNNQLVDVAPLVGLNKLTSLSLNGNQLVDIAPLAGLNKLTSLYLNGNQLVDVAPLAGLNKLTSLDLSKNQLVDVAPLAGLTNLNWLFLSKNPNLTSLRPVQNLLEGEMQVYDKAFGIYGLFVGGCPLVDPPREIVQEGTEAILRYWEAQDRINTTVNRTGRILLLGNGRAGKTSLADKLEDEQVPIGKGQRSQTNGIVIKQVAFSVKGEEYFGRIWDLGGQKDQHILHQYFFGRNSLYVVMVDPRKSETPYDHWLRMVDLLGSRDKTETTPVIVLYNVRGEAQGASARQVRLGEYEKLFEGRLQLIPLGINLGRDKAADAKNDVAWPGVVNLIGQYLSELPLMGDILSAYPKITERIVALREEGKNYIPYRDFSAFAQEEEIGLIGELEVADAAAYQHALGEIVYYPEGEKGSNLSKYVFLDPRWVTKALYRVIQQDHLEDKLGVFTDSELAEIWEKEGYELADQAVLKPLLFANAFELCYRINEHTFIYPGALPQNEEQLAWSPSTEDTLHFRLVYTGYVPAGLMTRFIVRRNADIDKGRVYRLGAVVRSSSRIGRGLLAAVTTPEQSNGLRSPVEIEVAGRGTEAIRFLGDLRNEFDKINDSFYGGVRPVEELACGCEACRAGNEAERKWWSLEDLLAYFELGEKSMVCSNSRTRRDISEMLTGVYSPQDLKERHVTIVNGVMNVNRGNHYGKGAIHQQGPDSTAEVTVEAEKLPEPWLNARNKKGLLAAAILSLITGIASWLYFPDWLVDYIWLPLLVVIALGAFWALTRENKYFSGGMAIFWASSGIVGMLQSLPDLDGYVKLKGEEARGFVRFAIESSTGLTVATLVVGAALAGWLFWLSWWEDNRG